MAEITLTVNEFKALSSNTRINILKLLKERNHTLSELSAKLQMASPTIKQHLDTLIQSDIVEQNDEGRKWKYYSLTRKGKNLLEPVQTNVIILIGVSAIALMAVMYVFISFSFYTGASAGYYTDSELGGLNVPLKESKTVSVPVKGETLPSEEGEITSDKDKRITVVYSPIDFSQLVLFLVAAVCIAIVFGYLVGKKKQNKALFPEIKRR
ncbi:MAG: winged helix-turn-helix domain-containing protein [archaeon]